VLRGRAFAGLGYLDAARATLAEALRDPARSRGVRHRALLERAQVAVSRGDRAAARADLDRILAEDPAHPGAAQLRQGL
jgi:uncharacterized protein HemY